MKKCSVYKFINNEKNIEKLLELGFEISEDALEQKFCKNIDMGKYDFVFNNMDVIFNDKATQEFVDMEELGLSYVDGKVVHDENFNNIAKSWKIIVDNDNWIGFTSCLNFYPNVYYGKEQLDTYCKEEIQLLIENEIIKESKERG